ncbi:MAG: phosphate/phosphite/phosphonate ABC transporter substrate-binding protein [Chloroflexi bacterium]|nr:phosphate/phosphite/phosphonate ABC transporter substrate-binding protein [Chloroflexota bacterium]
MQAKRILTVGFILVLLSVGVLSACAPKAAELGSEKNPIIWVFVPSGETERVSAGAQSVADLLQEETGLHFKTLIATEYAGAIEAMCSDPPQAHMASLATFAYVLAADRGCAEAALLSTRFGSPTYNGQIFVRADSGITSLDQLAGKTFCRPDPLSTSGWVIPSLMIRGEGVNPDTDMAEIVDAGSHDAVAAGVYNGDCDAGATYVDARTRIEEDFPDIMEQTVVIAIEPDIPNDGVQFVASLSQEIRDKIVSGLLAVAATEEGAEALGTAYQWEGLIEAGDSFYDPFRQILQASGVDITDLVKE